MFCSNCGKEIDEKAVICIHCGCATHNNQLEEENRKSIIAAILLCLFLGFIGLHRFYLGRTGSGVGMLLCFLFGWLVIPAIVLLIWWFIDLILIACGVLKAADGSKLK